MVTFLADECFSGPLLRAMLSAGFDVIRSADTIPSAPDEDVLALAYSQGRVLLTEDTDFGELTVRLALPTHGVIRVDLKSLNRARQSHRLVAGLLALGEQAIGSLTTIEPTRTRVRKVGLHTA